MESQGAEGGAFLVLKASCYADCCAANQPFVGQLECAQARQPLPALTVIGE